MATIFDEGSGPLSIAVYAVVGAREARFCKDGTRWTGFMLASTINRSQPYS
jgi:hypothetical protein